MGLGIAIFLGIWPCMFVDVNECNGCSDCSVLWLISHGSRLVLLSQVWCSLLPSFVFQKGPYNNHVRCERFNLIDCSPMIISPVYNGDLTSSCILYIATNVLHQVTSYVSTQAFLFTCH